jgi:hypothetical protein
LDSDLAGPVEITAGARRATVDDTYDPAANPLLPGATGDWPIVGGKTGPFDLGRPAGSMAAAVYLHAFNEAWVAMRRLDDTIAIALSWDAGRFPCAWLWYELGGTVEAPWHGRGRVIGIEPSRPGPAWAGQCKARGSAGAVCIRARTLRDATPACFSANRGDNGTRRQRAGGGRLNRPAPSSGRQLLEGLAVRIEQVALAGRQTNSHLITGLHTDIAGGVHREFIAARNLEIDVGFIAETLDRKDLSGQNGISTPRRIPPPPAGFRG